MDKIESIEQLEGIYSPVVERALWKEIDHINDHYRQFVEKAPFLLLATQGKQGIDCSPRGDPAGFVRVASQTQLLIPDRRGNNRLDSLRNIVGNPEVGLIFLIPGVGETLRVRGTAEILIDRELCESFSIADKPTSSVISVTVRKAYFQCQKALARSGLWDSASRVNRSELPTAGEMAQHFSEARGVEFDGKEYDDNYPEHLKKTIY